MLSEPCFLDSRAALARARAPRSRAQYARFIAAWLRVFPREQFLFVRMASLPKDTESALRLQSELATFLGMSLPEARSGHQSPGGGGACLGQSMVTSKRSRVRAHNATVKEVKRSFKSSPTAVQLKAFLDGHDRLLQRLLVRERVRIY